MAAATVTPGGAADRQEGGKHLQLTLDHVGCPARLTEDRIGGATEGQRTGAAAVDLLARWLPTETDASDAIRATPHPTVPSPAHSRHFEVRHRLAVRSTACQGSRPSARHLSTPQQKSPDASMWRSRRPLLLVQVGPRVQPNDFPA
ncbi:DUF6420 family protein [Streptomyces sp. NPDC051132]|uniref:DUF6420 family protein n=1 Tax=unclassified Streptomyces TaxID=2593676 RepID=UPI0034380555